MNYIFTRLRNKAAFKKTVKVNSIIFTNVYVRGFGGEIIFA